MKKKTFERMQIFLKETVIIGRDRRKKRRKTLKNEKGRRKIRKSQTTTTSIFLVLHFYIGKLIFC